MVRGKKSEGQVALGPLTIYFPDAGLGTFWFMQDLCNIVGVEYNSEARARLERALRGKMRGLDLDHEADNVVVHAGKAERRERFVVGVEEDRNPG